MTDKVDSRIIAQDPFAPDGSSRIRIPNISSRLDLLEIKQIKNTLIGCELMERKGKSKEEILFRYWEAMKYFSKERFHGSERMVFFKVERSSYSRKELLGGDKRDYYLFFNRESDQLAKVELQSSKRGVKRFKVIIDYFELNSKGKSIMSSEERQLSEEDLKKVGEIGMFSNFVARH